MSPQNNFANDVLTHWLQWPSTWPVNLLIVSQAYDLGHPTIFARANAEVWC